ILFGSFLAWGVVARISTKRRPGSAVVAVPQVKYDIIAVAIGVAAYLAFVFYLHTVLIGVPVITVRG
ncbi:MAG TPA: NnrU family protein, partial [Saliniramus sp.]|nr:NnrU family protein [Saliniramus sp.]